MQSAFSLALLVAAATATNIVITPNGPVHGGHPHKTPQSLLDTRIDLVGISPEFANEKFTSLLLTDINQKFGQGTTERQGLGELITFAATMPFRAVPQDTSYAFLRGVNTSDVFWQNPSSAKGTGLWFEPTSSSDCAVNTLKLSAVRSNTVAGTENQWGFKEHPFMYNYFYIYNRGTDRKLCIGRWLQAKLTTAECTATSALALAPYYGDDTLWTLIRHHGQAAFTGSTATPAWDGNPYTWVGTYTLRNVGKSGYGAGDVCTLTDLGVNTADSTLKWFDPKATTGKADSTNSYWSIDNLHPMLFATTHFIWQ